jgi:hypothetical protein
VTLTLEDIPVDREDHDEEHDELKRVEEHPADLAGALFGKWKIKVGAHRSTFNLGRH